jgi:hypothetical protein
MEFKQLTKKDAQVRNHGHWFDPHPMLDGSGVKVMPCQDRFLVHDRK